MGLSTTPRIFLHKGFKNMKRRKTATKKIKNDIEFTPQIDL
jgi:hypothetical protein